MPPPAGAVAPMPPVVPPAKPDHPGADLGVIEDANSSNSFITPTALTAPAGTWWFSDIDLFLVSGGYAITNEFQVSAMTLIPVSKDQPFWGVFNGKFQFLKQGRLRLAAQAALMTVEDDKNTYDSNGNSTGSTSQWYFAGEVGGAATLCFDDACRSHGSLFVGAGFAQGDNSAVPVVVAGSIAARINKHVKLIGEIDSGFIAGKIDISNGALVSYGVRFTSRNLGVDFGFMKPLVKGWDDIDVLPLGLPYLSFTYRSTDD